MFTAVLHIWHQPRRRSEHRTAPRGKKNRRDSSCRSRHLFKKYGAAAGGARYGILVFARAGQIFSTFLGGFPVNKRGSGGGGIKTRSVFRDAIPRWRFANFADAGKVGRPQAKSPRPFLKPVKRADNIRPYGNRMPDTEGGCYPPHPQKENYPQRAATGRSYAKQESPKAREKVPFVQSFSYGRRSETKFRTKFFAKLSFKKAGKKAGAPAGPGHGNSRRSHKIMEKQPQRLSGA